MSLKREIAEEIGGALVKGADKAVKTIGDMWGFKPKPGEMSGSEYIELVKTPNLRRRAAQLLEGDENLGFNRMRSLDQDQAIAIEAENIFEQINDRARNQLERLKDKDLSNEARIYLRRFVDPNEYPSSPAVYDLMNDFALMEYAGIPREYTGRLLRKNLSVPYVSSSEGVPMAWNADFKVFRPEILKQVPVEAFDAWADLVRTGLKDDVALAVVKNPPSKEAMKVVKSLAADWQGSADDLIDTAKLLTGG